MEFVGNVHLVRGGTQAHHTLEAYLVAQGIEVRGDPDVYSRSYTSFGIDEAQEVRERSQSKGLRGRRVFVLSMPHMTVEAQNALLKTLEEPKGDALFFLSVTAPEMLVPALRSRAQELVLSHAESRGVVDVHGFLAASPAKRLEMLTPLLQKDDDVRDLGLVMGFLSELERALSLDAARTGSGLEAVYRARKYLSDKGALVKPLLEQVALLVPVAKA